MGGIYRHADRRVGEEFRIVMRETSRAREV